VQLCALALCRIAGACSLDVNTFEIKWHDNEFKEWFDLHDLEIPASVKIKLARAQTANHPARPLAD
jgi:hypothetical protein